MRELVVRGSPRRLDAVLRPIVRGLQLGVAGRATRVLALLGAEGAAPIAHLARHGRLPAGHGTRDPFAAVRRSGRRT